MFINQISLIFKFAKGFLLSVTICQLVNDEIKEILTGL